MSKSKKSEKIVQYRQGDVFLKKVDSMPKSGLKKVPLDKGRVICAYGEISGHAHAIFAEQDEAVMYTDEKGNMWLETKQDVDLKHEEHGTIELEGNSLWSVIRQSEYHPERVRNVAD